MQFFTPGPWLISRWAPHTGRTAPSGIYRPDDDDDSCSEVDICDFPRDIACGDLELEGNAALISAAPDLLYACTAYLRAMQEYGHPDKTDRLMRRAVAKAKGRQASP